MRVYLKMNKLIIPLIVCLILISGCTTNRLSTNEEAEKTAEKFARYWEQGDYSSMYDLFVPELKKERTKEDFVNFFLASEKNTDIVIRLDKVSIDSEKVAYAYFTVSSSIYDARAPAMRLEYIENEWKFNAFATFFTDGCAEECIDYPCKQTTCSSETKFKCNYEDIEKCSCEKDLDCPYNRPLCLDGFCSAKQCLKSSECIVTQEAKDQCESKGLNFKAWVECSQGECLQHCREYDPEIYPKFDNLQQEENAKLKIKISQIGENIEIKNYDADLTKVTILINNKFKKELEALASGSELIISTLEFLDGNNKNLGSSKVDNFYLYAQQGKWWN